MRSYLVFIVVIVILAVAFIARGGEVPAATQANEWKPLFNGRDLAGWETWLGRPHASVSGVDVPKDEKGAYTGVVGLNNDPKKVFSVMTEDGAPAIRISGEIFGALTSTDEFEIFT
jgi:hypothetical protein